MKTIWKLIYWVKWNILNYKSMTLGQAIREACRKQGLKCINMKKSNPTKLSDIIGQPTIKKKGK